MNPNADEAENRVLAQAALSIVRRSFENAEAADRKCFRLKNLRDSEILEFLQEWEKLTRAGAFADVRVVIASDSANIFPDGFRAEPHRSITYYRNNNSGGLIYIETKVESDEQGLKNMFTLRDVNFLDGTFDEQEFSVPRELVRLALRESGSAEPDNHKVFIDRCVEVLDLIRKSGQTIPVRKFARFAVVAAAEVASAGALDGSGIDCLIGRNIIQLDMFPDENWRDEANRAARRLFLNLLRADLASSASTDLDPEKLVEQCARTVFRDPSGGELPAEEQTYWREICSNYCNEPRRENRSNIPYRIFEQLFERDVAGMKLGERVEQEIAQAEPQRLTEFEQLRVKEGLDKRLRDDAQLFLDAEPAAAEDQEFAEPLPLRDLLSRQTRHMIEKVARPNAETIENPLIKLADAITNFREAAVFEDTQHRVELRLGRGADASEPCVGLFAFLYGAALRELSEESNSMDGGLSLVVQEALTKAVPAPSVIVEDEESSGGEDDESDKLRLCEWKPVPLEYVLVKIDDGSEVEAESAVEWLPADVNYLALFWLSICAPDCGEPDQEITCAIPSNPDEWVASVTSRQHPICTEDTKRISEQTIRSSPVLGDLVKLRRALRASLSSDGLSTANINDFFDRWSELLQAAKKDHVPDGATLPEISAFLMADCISCFGENGVLMLASHPLRLRWISRYLEESIRLADKALAGSLDLNSSNPGFYLNWSSRLSPHRQPAIHTLTDGTLLYAAGEKGWCEHFKPEVSAGGSIVANRVSPSIIVEIARQIEQYLHAHPYKTDGLSILIVTGEAYSLAADIISEIRKGDFRSIHVTIELVAPRRIWAEAARLFEGVDSENRLEAGGKLLPPLELRLHELHESAPDVERVLSELSCDIAVVPELLKENVQPNEATRAEASELGTFKPLMSEPTCIRLGTNNESITVSMLPRDADVCLSAWSTLVVRNSRQSPVSSDVPEWTDYVDLNIAFSRAARFFERIHDTCHWVITIERHITRAQLERLEAKPDILVVRDRIGPGGLFTLIVSSNSGRKFIVQRLERKLEHIAKEIDAKVSGVEISEFAERIYDETRKLAPRLTLEALGVSRVSEEILGLAVARRIAEQAFPEVDVNGITAWISLDEHPEWLSGTNATRADMLRLTMDRTPAGELDVEILVIESKLRQGGFDAHGVEQVRTTLQLLDDVFPEEGSAARFDASLWRKSILAALETLSPDALKYHGDLARNSETGAIVPDSIRSDFIDGKFRVRSVAGMYCISTYSAEGKTAYENDTDDARIRIVRAGRSELGRLLGIAMPPPAGMAPRSASATGAGNTQSGAQHTPSSPTSPQRVDSPGAKITEPQAAPVSPPVVKAPDAAPRVENGSAAPARRTKLSIPELEARYQKVLDSYESFGIKVRIAETGTDRYTEGPASIIYRIVPGSGVDPRRINEKSDALKLNLSLTEEQQIRFFIDQGHVNIDVPKGDKDRYYVDANELWARWERPSDALAVPIGENSLGETVAISFSSANSPHLLIGGTTGSGKSEALNTILAGVTQFYSPEELRLLLIDPKGTELNGYSDSPFLEGEKIGWDDEDAINLLKRAVGEMQDRYAIFKSINVRSLAEYNQIAKPEERIPWWLIVLDEYADLTSDSDAKKSIEEQLKRLAQKARAAGIHVVIATQKPSSEVISTNLRSNLPAQLALRVKSAIESRVIMDESGAESLAGKGDAFLKADGRLTRVQCGKV